MVSSFVSITISHSIKVKIITLVNCRGSYYNDFAYRMNPRDHYIKEKYSSNSNTIFGMSIPAFIAMLTSLLNSYIKQE